MLPEHRKWDHAIELTPGAEPKLSKVYLLSLLEQEKLDAFLEENLRTGRIQPSKSPITAPVFFIKKKNGSLWLVQDYHVLNTVTIKNRYSLPLISKLISQLCGAKYSTSTGASIMYASSPEMNGKQPSALIAASSNPS